MVDNPENTAIGAEIQTVLQAGMGGSGARREGAPRPGGQRGLLRGDES